MNINKNGWSTLEMIGLSAGLLIALLISVFFISKLYGSMDNAFSSNSYITMESKLQSAAKDYLKDNDIEIDGQIKITLNTLMNNDLVDEFKDKDGHDCNGYVVINRIDGFNHYTSYIKCDNYTTKNYED